LTSLLAHIRQGIGEGVLKRVDVVSAVIHDDNGNLLVVKNRDGDFSYWGIPGGAVEDGETLEQAVIREVKEETGLDVVVTGLSSLREKFFTKSQHHVLFVTFFARVTGGALMLNDPDDEIVEIKWADHQTAKELMQSLYERNRFDSDADKTLAFYAYEGIQ